MKYLKKKLRLDEYLVENEYFENLEQAKRNIMIGNVIINEQKKEKAGEIIDSSKIRSIRIKEKDSPYVSRGGLKLEKAIKVFEIDFKDKVVLDIGASTGGFTDCALQNFAKFVYAVDVGTNQLDWKLRTNEKIKSIENKHINDLVLSDIDDIKPDIIVMDVSFISIKKVVDNIKDLMKEESIAIFLIKPQFEAEKEELDKGIVKDLDIHKKILKNVIEDLTLKEIYLKNITISPIRGGKGNIEYLAEFSLNKKYEIQELDIKINDLVELNRHNK